MGLELISVPSVQEVMELISDQSVHEVILELISVQELMELMTGTNISSIIPELIKLIGLPKD